MPDMPQIQYIVRVQMTVPMAPNSSTVATRLSLCVPFSIAHSPAAIGAMKAAGMSMRISAVWLLLLAVAVLATWRHFRAVNTVAGWLLTPYLLWCLFALYLNVGFVVLN